jgi:hypothetical protein
LSYESQKQTDETIAHAVTPSLSFCLLNPFSRNAVSGVG